MTVPRHLAYSLVAASLLASVAALPARMLHAQTVEDRINAILGQMSTAEKILQLHQEGGFNTADNTRLGIPGFVMADGPHGVRDGQATSFPVGIGMASTWDTSLARRVGVAMGKEFRGKGKLQGLGPCLDIDRDPRNGRSPETGGEDPYLCAQITTAVVRGMQSMPVIATVKHFNANHRENGRTSNNIIASQQVLHEHAGLAFRTAVQEGGALSVMNAYNLINGQKCAENTNLLTTILRTHWGFPYYVVSDWGSIWNSENAIEAGCDVCMGSNDYRDDLPGLVSSGAVEMSVLDEAVRRVLRTKIVAGMLDYVPPPNPDDVNSLEHQQLCLEAGRKSLVLLKNTDSILPLSQSPAGHIALIGPNAAVAQIDGSGSAYVTPFYTISPLQGIERLIGAAKVQYAKGCDINSADTSGFALARAAAAGADAVIFCGGLDTGQEGEGFDRVGGLTELPGKQQDLINAVAAVNPNVVAAIFSGGVCTLSRSIANIRGLVYAFYPGQEGGAALADVLFGEVNPGGKLPVTMPVSQAQLPAWNDNLNDDYGCGYRWFDKMSLTPQFAFGFGMSYTTFAYANLVITPATVNPGEPVTVSVDVTNTGSRAGEEVVQLYLTDVASTLPVAVKQLAGFRRIALEPSETKTVTIVLTADEMYYFNESTGQYDIEAGTFQVRVGGSSDNLPLAGTFNVADAVRKPDLRLTGMRMVPPYPVPGQKVIFLATVKNHGAAATEGGVPLKVAFTLQDTLVSWSSDVVGSIPPGGMALVCGNTGVGGVNAWTSGPVGTYTVGAVVDPDNTVDECVETNNLFSSGLAVYPVPLPNLALRKTVSVTSVEKAGLEGEKAVDGSLGTRWSSAFSDPQTMLVDLGASYMIDDVTLYWEAAYGKEYKIVIWDEVTGWRETKHEVNGDGGMDRIAIGAAARKIMMIGLQRATQYGYSLWEFEVHGSLATGVGDEPRAALLPGDYALDGIYPNPFNPATSIQFSLPTRSRVTVEIFTVLGQTVERVVDGDMDAGVHTLRWAPNLGSGVYFCRMTATAINDPTRSHTQTKRVTLLR